MGTFYPVDEIEDAELFFFEAVTTLQRRKGKRRRSMAPPAFGLIEWTF